MFDWKDFQNAEQLLELIEDETFYSNITLSSFSKLKSNSFSLEEFCQKLVIGDLDLQQRIETVREVLKKSSNLEEDLFNLLGCEYLDDISLLIQNKDSLVSAALEVKSLSTKKRYPHVYSKIDQTKYLTDFGGKFSLPSDTIRQLTDDLEMYTIPACKSNSHFSIPTISISQFSKHSQKAFSGYSCLNQMQSAVFPLAYKTNENLLVCAPTGSGKTDVATMVILKAIEDHLVISEECSSGNGAISITSKKNPTLDKSAFKIVYIAPMKALVNEIVQKFTKKLSCYGIVVREYSGDINLTKKEIDSCNMIVATPEKWDVVTRKGSVNDSLLISKVCLLIIDEVHLLNDARGPVIESIVTRTHRQVEISQKMMRIVGLSATLPNYLDVAVFLGVNPERGMFYFDDSFRPVPLQSTLVGIKARGRFHEEMVMDNYTFQVLLDSWRDNYQVLIFVHSRNETTKVAKTLIQKLQENGISDLFFNNFNCENQDPAYEKCQNYQIKELFRFGIASHHAGLSRNDRHLIEKLFIDKKIGLLCCTATLAWGVNLPAHTVVIRGTNVYDSSLGGFADLSILDVLQIFGRAGRPQFEQFGEAHLVTNHDKLYRYINMLLCKQPIESQFKSLLGDNMNAEIVLGSIATVQEAVSWLRYSYLYIRMLRNPSVYGITPKQCESDPSLIAELRKLSVNTLKKLKKIGMIGFDEKTEVIKSKELGRIASNFYLKIESVEHLVSDIRPNMSEENILDFISSCHEFTDSLKIRETESRELEILEENYLLLPSKCIKWEVPRKTNILAQSIISNGKINNFSLEIDANYINQNFSRIARSVFQYCLLKGYANSSRSCLNIAHSFEHKLWWHLAHPLAQFKNTLSAECIKYISKWNIAQLKEMSFDELVCATRTKLNAKAVFKSINAFPIPNASASIQPITDSILRVNLEIWADFQWSVDLLGNSQNYWISLFDYSGNTTDDYFLHNELISLNPFNTTAPLSVSITIPIKQPIPNQIYVEIFSDLFFGCEVSLPISYQHLIIPQMKPIQTDLLRLSPLPKQAFHNALIESLYSFDYFNPIQTQIFHCLYYGTDNVLLGSPTGSGKTISSEIAIWNSLRNNPSGKIIYISPLKALVKERLFDWRAKFRPLGLNIVEMSGDTSPDLRSLLAANIVICTPEKWDGVSRDWKKRKYLWKVSLVIIDEIHLLGTDRGPVLECIVSRLRCMSEELKIAIRIVGLSTALANAYDLADWLGITKSVHNYGLFNFRPSVRPVPLTVYIDGFPGVHYCPRMESMNKPCYNAILAHSSEKPVIIFVSSRRQTRKTSEGLISYVVNTSDSKKFLHVTEDYIESLDISEPFLRHSLLFGIGIHHAGLAECDKKIVEDLFLNGKIQVLIATSTLAWGVNFPAHLVIVKGTEYFDPKTKRYVDYPITDVLQMMGRAGRPQFDTSGSAVIFTSDVKKEFYKKFLYEPFPVESSLVQFLPDFFNAEISTGSVSDMESALQLMQWTFFYRRIQVNPTYYGLNGTSNEEVIYFLKQLITSSVNELVDSFTVEIVKVNHNMIKNSGLTTRTDHQNELKRQQDVGVANSSKSIPILKEMFISTVFGKIASFYYTSHKTIRMMVQSLKENANLTLIQLLKILSLSTEYELVPVRHNEDVELKEFCIENVQLKSFVSELDFELPSTKTFILFLCHLEDIPLPISDFVTDTTSILEQSVRLLQALIDICVEMNSLSNTICTIRLLQHLKQGTSILSERSFLFSLPFTKSELNRLANVRLFELLKSLSKYISPSKTQNYITIQKILSKVPSFYFEQQPLFIKASSASQQLFTVSGVICRKFNSNCDTERVAYCPRFPKGSEEMIFLVVSYGNDVLKIKRLLFGQERSKIKFSFEVLLTENCTDKITIKAFVDAYPEYEIE